MRKAALAIAGLVVGVAVANAEVPDNVALSALLAPEPGNKACYARSYDVANLRAHPRQRMTAMTFLLTVQAYEQKPADAKTPEDLVYYPFAMSVARRGDKRLLHTSGDCMNGATIGCVVDCDGGGVTLDKMPPANTLILRIKECSTIAIRRRARWSSPAPTTKFFVCRKSASKAAGRSSSRSAIRNTGRT